MKFHGFLKLTETLKCELFIHFGSCFSKLQDVSTSQLEALVRTIHSSIS